MKSVVVKTYVEWGGRRPKERERENVERWGMSGKGQEKDAPDLLIGYSRKGYADEIESGRRMV